MRILITGGFGFVGGRVALCLHQAGHQIVLASRHLIDPPIWLPQAKVVKAEWNDIRALERICTGVDVIIQAAGMNAQDCASDPVSALEFNGLATSRLLSAAIRSSVKRFIYLSTAHVYASPLVGTIYEDACPRNLHPYATSHLAGENIVLGANKNGEIEGIVTRLSNAFGSPVDKDVNCWMLLINDLCRQAVNTGKMVLHSSGIQHRDFIAMTEVCRFLEHLTLCDSKTLFDRIFNIASGVSQPVIKTAELIQDRCELTLGFRPELQRLKNGRANEKHETLELRTDQLAKMGLQVELDNSIEIDSLLMFCNASNNKSLSD
jgi:UDP-glucose 4-epimerase